MPVNSTPQMPDLESLLRRFQLQITDVQRHVMRPDHLPAANDRLRIDIVKAPAKPWIGSFFSFLYTLNLETLDKKLHDILQPCSMGYALELRRSGSVVLTRTWHWSKSVIDGIDGWKVVTPMHLASVSKLITAIAITRLLDSKRISYDERIGSWLPTYWARGKGVDTLTFRHLLTHTSGLLQPALTGQAGPCDYPAMQSAISAGSTGTSMSDYKNINYSLCRVLLATVNGDIPPSLLAGAPSGVLAPFFAVRDQVWDLLTTRAYADYVNEHVFGPSGVPSRAFEHPDEDALAYAAPGDYAKGWNSGDLQTASGAVGWHLSVRELQHVLRTLRTAGTIMSAARAQAMLDNGFGIDVTRNTSIGTVYGKGGWWQGPAQEVEQSSAFVLPRSMELVILVNSPPCAGDSAVFFQAADAIEQSVELNLSALLTGVVGKLFGP